MPIYPLLAAGSGAFIGACLRYLFGTWFNPVFPTVPLGTLAANLLGGLLMGLILGAFAQFQSLSPATRVFVTTGCLGGLTTFSTFSGETITLLLRGQYGWTATIIGAHLIGTLGMTLIGFALMQALLRSLA
ncbi:MAG: fluoride efflux transporter CrcB [Rhodanobacteraceae bacterium]|nr:MAG: fluoride efflux transporter CrcB [Rhodanobacteraceae bacterium]